MAKAPYDEVYYVCPICGGEGTIIDEYGDEECCPMCRGRGEVEEDDPEYREWCDEHYGD